MEIKPYFSLSLWKDKLLMKNDNMIVVMVMMMMMIMHETLNLLDLMTCKLQRKFYQKLHKMYLA